ncbi:MAG TPA: diguanylate cyclase [Petrotogaceae bacterium]|nr:diguanylate cyclase [Petrotogaceae bacterium]HQP57607.1 diguanylate cyclase [Petrotogaceae bacterium]
MDEKEKEVPKGENPSEEVVRLKAKILEYERTMEYQKKLEDSLKKSEEIYKLLTENSTDIVSKHSSDGIFTFVSPSIKNILGYSAEELIGTSIYQLFNPQDLISVKRAFSSILALPTSSTFSYRIKKKDGAYLWFETTGKSIRDEFSGVVKGIILISRNINEKKLIESELTFRNDLRNLTEKISNRLNSSKIQDIEDDLIALSTDVAKLFSYDDGDVFIFNEEFKSIMPNVYGKLRANIVLEHTQPDLLDDFQKYTGKSIRSFAFFPLSIEKNVIGMLALYNFQTESSITESLNNNIRTVLEIFASALGRMLDNYKIVSLNSTIKVILDNIPQAYIHINNEGLISDINSKAQEYLPLKKDDPFAKIVSDNSIFLKDSKFDREFKIAWEKRLPVSFEEFDISDNSWYEVRMIPASDGLSIFFRDITQQRTSEEKLVEYATKDSLTGVLNRRAGLIHLQKLINICKTQNKNLCIGYIDIDNLKKINDKYGQNEGDFLLTLAIKTLRENLREGDIICRVGGDEFLIIFPDTSIEEILQLWQEIDRIFRQFNETKKKPYSIYINRGFSQFDQQKNSTLDAMLANADRELTAFSKKPKSSK